MKILLYVAKKSEDIEYRSIILFFGFFFGSEFGLISTSGFVVRAFY